ncbi:hypothetical protein ABVT39_014461 [Epinephelus coioides]
MRESYPDLRHQFDPWHVAKGDPEVFHSSMLKYAETSPCRHKSNCVGLSVIDHNHNVGHQHDSTQAGKQGTLSGPLQQSVDDVEYDDVMAQLLWPPHRWSSAWRSPTCCI